MHKKLVILILCTAFFLSCSGDKKDDSKAALGGMADSEKKISIKEKTDFSIEAFIDTVSSEPLRVSAAFLKASLMDGDYKAAAQYLCGENRNLLVGDSLSDFIIYGKNNPEWNDLTRLRYDITRRYIPVLARYNDITLIEEVDCKEYCRVRYDITGPLLILKMYDVAFGENGKKRFDTYIDSNVSLEQKMEFYDWAFERLEKVADSLDYAKRLISDTLFLIKENQEWKVARDAKNSLDIFRQK